MKPTALASLLPLLLLAAVAAQDEPLMPVAKEVEKLSVLLGDWTGEGTMSEPSGDVTKWTARRSARWSHGGHFVEEDYAFTFDGMAQPYVWRTYVGWDRERSRYCAAIVGSDGAARLEDLQWLPDGTLLQFATRRQGGMTYVERTRLTFGGDTIGYASEILMPMGPSLALVDGTFRRGGEAFGGAFETAGWMGAKPHESLVRLARMSGTYVPDGLRRHGHHGPHRWRRRRGAGQVRVDRVLGARRGEGRHHLRLRRQHGYHRHDGPALRRRSARVDIGGDHGRPARRAALRRRVRRGRFLHPQRRLHDARHDAAVRELPFELPPEEVSARARGHDRRHRRELMH
jgi:hypothetical protein